MEKLDLSFQNNERAKKGSLLISDPFMNDLYFGRSVVLLCEHNNEGTFGFVLNNYVDIDLHKMDETFPDIGARISFGGPMAKENLFFIHSLGKEITESIMIGEDLYYSGNFDEMITLLSKKPELNSKVRFFVGYSGWGIGQLDDELKEHSWIPVNNIPVEMIMDTTNDKLWANCLELQGERFKMISKFPKNPSDN